MSTGYNWNQFKSADQIPSTSTSSSAPEAPSNSYWEQFKPLQEDSTLKKAARYAYQVPAGYASKFTMPLDIAQQMGVGEALGEYEDLEERLPELQRIFPQAPWDQFKGLDKERYMEAVKTAQNAYPTQSNIEGLIEEKTGLPLTPETRGQNLFRLGGAAAGFRPGGLIEKATAGVAAPVISERAKEAGLPEWAADMVGLGGSQVTPIPKQVPVGLQKQLKPSGLANREFEKVTKPTRIGSSDYDRILKTIEKDFRTNAYKMFEESSSTYREMKTNPNFRAERIAKMEEVQEQASGLVRKVNTNDVRSALEKRVNARQKKGFASSEYDEEFQKEIDKLIKRTPENKPISALDLHDQYRKTNGSYSDVYERGSSNARNDAKLDALRTYNRAVSDVIQRKYPNTKFARNFIKENEAWSSMMDADRATNFVDSFFEKDGKIDFKSGREILGEGSTSRSLRKMLGDQRMGKFRGLVNDFMQQGEKIGLLKRGKKIEGRDLVKNALLIHADPIAGAGAMGMDLLGSGGVRGLLMNSPMYDVLWKKLPQSTPVGATSLERTAPFLMRQNKELVPTADTSQD